MLHGNNNYHRCPACGCVCQTSEYERAKKMVNGDSIRIATERVKDLEGELRKAKLRIAKLEAGGQVSTATEKRKG